MSLPDSYNYMNYPLSMSLDENLNSIKSIMNGSSDLLVNDFKISDVRCCLLCLEGMVSTSTITNLILNPLTDLSLPSDITSDQLYEHISGRMLIAIDRAFTIEYGVLITRLMSGFAVLLIDGVATAICLGVQGYATRGISEPSSEGNIRGSYDGFVETVRTNMSLVRRRIKSPLLQFDLFSVTTKSNVDVIIAYLDDRVPKKLVNDIKKKLQNMELETILGSGYIEPYLNDTKLSMFSGVSVTERPDVFCAKLLEGRVGLLIDGTPFAIVIPSLFIENFQTLDDYNFRPYFATFLRWIRYGAFLMAAYLPALYVAIVTFHPELFNHTLLVTLAVAEEQEPLPLVAEVIISLLSYEVIKEAAVRLPKAVGGAVSLVGGLIIGDAAVSAGIISNPLLLICAISVTASFVVPELNQPITVLRIVSVIAGGVSGLYGIALIAAVMTVNICSLENYGVPVMSPVSPFTPAAMRDVLVRIGFKKLAVKNATVENLKGVNMK
jgi:spore germination protein KA